MQFWDRDSFVDGPIRSLLYMLESEYPFHTVELIRLLSALCSGMWSAECVYVISLNVQIIAYMNCNFFWHSCMFSSFLELLKLLWHFDNL